MLRAPLQKLLVDIPIFPGFPFHLHTILLAGQLSGERGVEGVRRGFVMIQLPAHGQLRIPFDIRVRNVRPAQRPADGSRGST